MKTTPVIEIVSYFCRVNSNSWQGPYTPPILKTILKFTLQDFLNLKVTHV